MQEDIETHTHVVVTVPITTVLVVIVSPSAVTVVVIPTTGPAVARAGMPAVPVVWVRLCDVDHRRRDVGTGNTRSQCHEQSAAAVDRIDVTVTHWTSPLAVQSIPVRPGATSRIGPENPRKVPRKPAQS